MANPAVAAWAAMTPKPNAAKMLTLLSKFYSEKLIIIQEGWFKDTLPMLEPGQKFALVNLDCSMYSSAMTVLTHLFENGNFSDGCHLLIGGFVGPKTMTTRKAWLDCVEKYKPDFSDLGFFGAGHWHFILHR